MGITTYRATGEVVSSNRAAAMIAGALIEQLQSQNFRGLETWKHSGLLEAADTALACMKGTRLEIHATSSFGREGWLYARFVPFTHMAEKRLLFITEDIAERKLSEKPEHEATVERERLVRKELQAALDNVKLLQGLLPICSNCKKIRDSDGVWSPVETYITKHSEASFTHGVCPDCVKLLYGDVPGTKA